MHSCDLSVPRGYSRIRIQQMDIRSFSLHFSTIPHFLLVFFFSIYVRLRTRHLMVAVLSWQVLASAAKNIMAGPRVLYEYSEVPTYVRRTYHTSSTVVLHHACSMYGS